MIGQSLVFEPDPAVAMVDDDNPWVEGLFFIMVIGFVAAIAQADGGILLTASLPNPAAMLEAVLQLIRSLASCPDERRRSRCYRRQSPHVAGRGSPGSTTLGMAGRGCS
ncbi:MAG: hypothetical protein R2856_06300 [Caldilineaceae bacterium]